MSCIYFWSLFTMIMADASYFQDPTLSICCGPVVLGPSMGFITPGLVHNVKRASVALNKLVAGCPRILSIVINLGAISPIP